MMETMQHLQNLLFSTTAAAIWSRRRLAAACKSHAFLPSPAPRGRGRGWGTRAILFLGETPLPPPADQRPVRRPGGVRRFPVREAGPPLRPGRSPRSLVAAASAGDPCVRFARAHGPLLGLRLHPARPPGTGEARAPVRPAGVPRPRRA